jgi:HEAT repeat protein
MEIANVFRVPLLLIALKRGSDNRRANAALALGESRSRLAYRALIRALRDPYSHVRFRAADALAEIADRRALPILESIWENKQEEDIVVLTAILHALRVLDPKKYGEPYVIQKAAY